MLAVKVGQQTTGDSQPEVAKTTRESGKPTIQNQAVNSALIGAGKQIVTQGVTQYADLTGNYAQAEAFNNVLTIGSDIAILSTGPVGLIAVGSKYAINISNSFVKQKRAVDNINLQRERLGFVSTSGSRYTK